MNLSIVQTIFGWWTRSVAEPLAHFVLIEHTFASALVASIVCAILLGFFYTPTRYSMFGQTMELYGFPLAIIMIALFLGPVALCVLIFLLPIIIVLAILLGTLLVLFLGVQRLRKY